MKSQLGTSGLLFFFSHRSFPGHFTQFQTILPHQLYHQQSVSAEWRIVDVLLKNLLRFSIDSWWSRLFVRSRLIKKRSLAMEIHNVQAINFPCPKFFCKFSLPSVMHVIKFSGKLCGPEYFHQIRAETYFSFYSAGRVRKRLSRCASDVLNPIITLFFACSSLIT